MSCENCDPKKYYLGKVVKTMADLKSCLSCGELINLSVNPIYARQHRWDTYFHNICKSVASKSPCLSRQIGVIIVRDNSIVSTGYNGPPRGIPHCGHERFMKDEELNLLAQLSTFPDEKEILRFRSECPRKVLGYLSGTHMELCPAQHAEQNAVSNAARNGVSTVGCTLYMNCVVPCKACIGTIINAGIVEVVIESTDYYDNFTKFIIENSNLKIREFSL